MNLSKFTEKAQEAILEAQTVAQAFGHQMIEPEHLMLSLIRQSDGIVPHHIAREQETPITENIRVIASHVGLGFSATVLHAIADRLAQPESDWQPFRKTCWRRIFYA